VGFDAAPERRFGGDQHWILIDLERRDAEPVEMCSTMRTITWAASAPSRM
jgi:hypothetical protein